MASRALSQHAFHNLSGFYLTARSFNFSVLRCRRLPAVQTNKRRAFSNQTFFCFCDCKPAELGPQCAASVRMCLMDQSLMHHWLWFGFVFKKEVVFYLWKNLFCLCLRLRQMCLNVSPTVLLYITVLKKIIQSKQSFWQAAVHAKSL